MTTARRLLLTAALTCAAAGQALAASPRAGRPPAPWRGEVFVVGSSSIGGDLGTQIEADLANQGFDVLRHGVKGSGLARPDRYDWFATSAWLPVSTRTLAVIFYLGVNDAQGIFEVGREWLPGLGRPEGHGSAYAFGTPRWSQAYLRRMVAFIDSFCRRGARDVFVLLPVDVRNPRLEERLVAIRALQVEAVRWSQCGRVLDTRGDAAWLAGEGERTQARRAPDGFHLTRIGAHHVWTRLRDQVLDALDRIEGLPPGRAVRSALPPPPADSVRH